MYGVNVPSFIHVQLSHCKTHFFLFLWWISPWLLHETVAFAMIRFKMGDTFHWKMKLWDWFRPRAKNFSSKTHVETRDRIPTVKFSMEKRVWVKIFSSFSVKNHKQSLEKYPSKFNVWSPQKHSQCQKHSIELVTDLDGTNKAAYDMDNEEKF